MPTMGAEVEFVRPYPWTSAEKVLVTLGLVLLFISPVVWSAATQRPDTKPANYCELLDHLLGREDAATDGCAD
jgi:hypothetical protein